MDERNSEHTLTKVVAALATAVPPLLVLLDSLFEAGLFDSWPKVAAVVGGLLAAAGAAGIYTASRPRKHLAMAARERASKLPGGAASDPSSEGS